MPRVDLFTTIHKGIRVLLFDISTEAARIDLASCIAVDGLVERIHRTIAFLDEHAHHEDTHVIPAVKLVASELATSLGIEHRVLDAIQTQVAVCADGLACADIEGRGPVGAQLSRLLNRLTAAQLSHMHREETEVNEVLWAAYEDADLTAIRGRLVGSIPRDRYAEWMTMIAPALNPVERSLVVGAAVG
jgi:hypothetical protein